jgi:O-antigen/teichoic acid export membrane protein
MTNSDKRVVSPTFAESVPSFLRPRRLVDWSIRIARFGVIQGLVQLLLGIAGLLIVRSLSKSEYALFAIANSMQVACTQLADLGVGIGVRSIGGRVWQDRWRFGQLLNTALGLRRQFAVGSMTICLPVTAWLLRSNNASVMQTIGLCLLVIAAVIPLLGISVWTASLLMHSKYRRVQKLDVSNAGLRLSLVGALAASHINAMLAASVGVITSFIQAFFLRRWTRAIADPAANARPDDRKELLRLSAKTLPNTVFFCFQGQVTLFILTWFGGPTGIADITALGRLALLFVVFSVMFGNVLGPRFARCQNPLEMRRLYLLFLTGTGAVLLPLWALAAVFPAPFLWLLGAKYGGLQRECGWVVATGCLSQFAGVMWNMSSSKAWIRVQSVAFVPVILGAQLMAALFLDLRNFHNVVLFSFITVIAPIPLYAIDAYLGFRKVSAHPVVPSV